MKYVAWILILILVAGIVGVGYVYATAQVVVVATGVSGVAASEHEALFNDYKRRLENGTVHGTVYQPYLEGEAEDYMFLTYTVRLQNNCFIDADMVEMQVVPWEGLDVLQIGEERPKKLTPRTTGDLSSTVLSKKGNNTVRQVVVTFYMWGMPFTVKETIGGT